MAKVRPLPKRESTSPAHPRQSVRRAATTDDLDRALGANLRSLMRAAAGEVGIPESTQRVAQLLVKEARRSVRRVQCTISMVPPDQLDAIRVVAGSGPWARRLVGHQFPSTASLSETAMRRGRTLETISASRGSALGAALSRGGIETGRVVPLMTRQALPDGRHVLGVVGFWRRGKDPFTPLERAMIDDYTRLVALSLSRAVLREEADRTARRLQTGVEVAVELVASLDPRAVLRRLLQRAMDAVGADRGSLSRIDGDSLVVEDSYDRAGTANLAGTRWPHPVEPLVERAIAKQQPILGGRFDLTRLPQPLRAELADVRHTATVPLLLGDRVHAVLVLSRRRDPGFTAADVATLQLIGNIATLALRNATLFAQAEGASRVKGEFLNMAAHELRTPLSVISGYVSMLRDGSFGTAPESWERPLNMLATKAMELGGLVDELLLASRLETGMLPGRRGRLDLRRLVREAVNRAQPRAALLNAELSHRLPAQPVTVEADPGEVGRILDNLINNALTYSRGRPWVQVTVSGQGGPRVAVEDHGVGVPSELHERIFERFFRIEDPKVGFHPGSGLGLPISRDLAARHSAVLTLERSEPGRGSTFVLRFSASGRQRPNRPRSLAVAR
jgi:signal transduction histidine kinase